MTNYVGPCFTTPRTDPATCRHETPQQFSWYARDDTVPGGEILIVICMGCDTVIQEGVTKRAAPAKARKARKYRGVER